MKISNAQMVFAKAKVYSGAIDGDAGPKTKKAIVTLEDRNLSQYTFNPKKRASWQRRMIAAVQLVLNAMGLEAGKIDGYAGHNTHEALTSFMSEQVRNSPARVHRSRALGRATKSHPAQMNYPRQRSMSSFYGKAGGAQCTAGRVKLPIKFKLAWNTQQKISSFSCHEKLAAPMTAVFDEAVRHYGEKRFRSLRLDLFGGCYNFRKKRGGATLSTHAYGAAFDLDPERNRLRWGADRAAFAGEDYVPFFEICMANGGTPAGYAWGKDWMHVQWARL